MADSTRRKMPLPIRSFSQLLRRQAFQEALRSTQDPPLRNTQDPPLPSTNGYPYEPLPTPTSIRLLELSPLREGELRRAKLIVVDLKETPNYDCLSYVWGKRTDPGTCICDDHEVSITRSLASFLETYCPEERPWLYDAEKPPPVWIDSICINQDDLEELSSQVALMGRVYSQAQCVHIWLGNSDPSLDYEKAKRGIDRLGWMHLSGRSIGLEPISRYIQPIMHCDKISDALRIYWRRFQTPLGWADDEDQDIECMSHSMQLLQHPWFERAWTYQESMLASKRQFRFGSGSVSDDKNMAYAVEALFDLFGLTGKLESDVAVENNIGMWRFLIKRAQGMLGSSEVKYGGTSLTELLSSRRGAACEREQDVVFSLLGLANDRHGIIVDYAESLSQLFSKIARGHLERSGSLAVLSYSDACRRVQERQAFVVKRLEMPYWVPDWNLPLDSLTTQMIYSRSYSCGMSKPMSISFSTDGKRLFIQGLLLGHIASVVDRFLLGRTIEQVTRDALFHLRKPPGTIRSKDIRAIVRTYLADERYSNKRWSMQELQGGIETEDANLIEAINCIKPFFAIFSTDNGLLGRAPKTAQVGDIIAVLWGSPVPFVLRKTPFDTYRVVGECYVDEMMDGQAIKEEGESGYEEYLQSLKTFVFD